MSCDICKEKDKEIADRDKQITRILKSYKKEKRIYWIAIAILIIVSLYAVGFGPKGLLMSTEVVKEIIK